MKKILLGAAIIIVLVALAGFVMLNHLSDLRTPSLKKGVTTAMEAKGRLLLQQSMKALGGAKAWKKFKQQTLRVKMTDTWVLNFMTKMFVPKNLSGVTLALTFQPNQTNSRLQFLSGPRKGSTWGIQNWMTYTVKGKQALDWKHDKDIKFFLPTYQYFALMPFYLSEAQKVAYAGEKKLNGKAYHLVFATWKDYKPQRDMDQYLIWVEKESKRIHYVEFTVRDKLASIRSTAKLLNYKKVQGLWLPHRVDVQQQPSSKKWMHKMEFAAFQPLPNLPPNYLLPDPKRVATK
ncbi:MAG: hypothetical protein EP343_25115 [Deltaproteobacteria bacterium]|nr:MAG: hypothetical protein EP343_25115 [Deltaproteobacteria bacterium]